MRLLLCEVIQKLEDTKNRLEGAAVLQQYASYPEVKWVCYMSFHPDAPKFPFKEIEYKKNKNAKGFNHQYLHHNLKVFDNMLNDKMPPEKAARRMRLILEDLYWEDAQLLHMVIRGGVVGYKGFNHDVAHQAFPDIVPPKDAPRSLADLYSG